MVKPYYEEGGITIYHGDCREVLPTLGRFDLLLTDPPYGINAARHRDSRLAGWKDYGEKAEAEWDKTRPGIDVLEMAIDSCRDSIIWGGNYFNLPINSKWLVWDKMQRDFSLADVELAWTSLPGASRAVSISRGEALQDGRYHPTQKPVAVMRWCIGQTKKTRSIVDCFMGSGSTLLAAKIDGIKATGIEMVERYCEVAAERLRQGVLF
tara:strand:+ start:181 stop:807 length:627 start_codon:yes stop_codon:yes gene_type:complete